MNTNSLTKIHQWILFTVSYLGWFACVFAGKFKLDLVAYLVPLVFSLLLHRLLGLTKNSCLVFLIIALLGVFFDSIALNLNWIRVVHSESNDVIPHWLVALWILFALSTPLYGKWLLDKRVLTAILGFFIGPLTYYSGAAFDVLIIDQKMHLLYYAIFWAVFFPWILGLHQKFHLIK